MVQDLMSFSGMSFGASSLLAASATLPKVVVRLDAACVITPFDTVQDDGSTFHSFAAACTSIMRAAAPPLRTYSCDWRIPWLPAVWKFCQTRLRATFWPGDG